MYSGKLVFAQVMEHLPLHTFRRVVSRYAGEHKVKSFSCLDSVPVHGLRTVDLPGESAGHQGVPARATHEAVSPRDPIGHRPQHTGQCSAQLAHLCRLRPEPDPYRAATLCRGPLRGRSQRRGVRAGCHHHRPVLVGLPVGALSLDQSGWEAPHPAESARQYPGFYPHQRWQIPRGPHPRRTAARGGSLLRHGPGLHRLRASAPAPPGRKGIRYRLE